MGIPRSLYLYQAWAIAECRQQARNNNRWIRIRNNTLSFCDIVIIRRCLISNENLLCSGNNMCARQRISVLRNNDSRPGTFISFNVNNCVVVQTCVWTIYQSTLRWFIYLFFFRYISFNEEERLTDLTSAEEFVSRFAFATISLHFSFTDF